MTDTVDRDFVAGYFQDSSRAERAIRALREAGFAQIGVASRDPKRARRVAERTDIRTGLAMSSGTGGGLNAVMGESAFSDSRQLTAALREARLSEGEAAYFDRMLQRDGVLVTVQAAGAKVAEVERAMNAEGGDLGRDSDRESKPEAAMPPPSAGAAPPAVGPIPFAKAVSPVPKNLEAEGEHSFRLQGEVLHVRKDRVKRGEVRLRKEVVTEHQHMEVPVSHEELVIERGAAASGTPVPGEALGSGGEIRITLSEEKASVDKQRVIREEVRVSRRDIAGTQAVDTVLQHEELRIDSEGRLSPEELDRLRKPRKAA